MGTFWNFMRGEFIVSEADVQRRLERRFPRDFKLKDDTLAVTVGNIVGGTLLVAGVYWVAYLRRPAI